MRRGEIRTHTLSFLKMIVRIQKILDRLKFIAKELTLRAGPVAFA
jgi:hypothetical protein